VLFNRYVIDETVGSVDVLCQFDSLGTMPDSHEIRVIDGKVKYVYPTYKMHLKHTLTSYANVIGMFIRSLL
jgi:hypothetical protein